MTGIVSATGSQHTAGSAPLSGSLRVVDLAPGIGGSYCTKLLADAGAEVFKVEPAAGDPLRRRHLLGGAHSEQHSSGDSPLFEYLHCSKRSVTVDPHNSEDLALLHALISASDAVVWSPKSPLASLPSFQPEALRAAHPHAEIITMTPFGLVGEPARPCNEFTLQAMAGGACGRGTAEREPLGVGAEFGEWIAGSFAAVAVLVTRHRSRTTGTGELADVSMLDALHLTQTMFAPTFFRASGVPYRSARVRTIPLIHPTADGYVGFQITTGQQWLDFCALIGREDWAADPTMTRFATRIARFDEVNTVIDGWTSQRSTDEIVEIAALMRLPVAPVADGATVPTLEQSVARCWFVPNPGSGFTQPIPPYVFHGNATSRPFEAPPAIGQDNDAARRVAAAPIVSNPTGALAPLPFDGLRVADFTAFWAGPIISHVFAMLGADVIHVESTKRPDGIRSATLKSDMGERWWEASPTFAGTNTNKRDVALDLGSERGREVALRLITQCDVLLDNYSTRVMENWGFDYETLHALKPDLIVVRAPGFGLTGPWRDRLAYATTIEQACGAASVTGYSDDRPDVAGGALDPVAGTHAAYAILLALEHRLRTGEGLLVEVPQFTSGTNVFAEPVIEYSATGRLLTKVGSRSWTNAPQGAYRVRDAERSVATMPSDEWVAISIETDEQWRALCAVIGAEDLASDPRLGHVDGRYVAHDAIDAVISAWTRDREAADVIDVLTSAGVPTSLWVQVHQLDEVAETQRRALYEMVDNPVLGTVPIVGLPIRFEAGPERFHRRRAPLLGEHNVDVLSDVVGLSAAEITQLEADGIIGTVPMMGTAW